MQYWFASFRDNCGRHAGLSLLAWHVLFAWFAAGMFSAFSWFLVCRDSQYGNRNVREPYKSCWWRWPLYLEKTHCNCEWSTLLNHLWYSHIVVERAPQKPPQRFSLMLYQLPFNRTLSVSIPSLWMHGFDWDCKNNVIHLLECIGVEPDFFPRKRRGPFLGRFSFSRLTSRFDASFDRFAWLLWLSYEIDCIPVVDGSCLPSLIKHEHECRLHWKTISWTKCCKVCDVYDNPRNPSVFGRQCKWFSVAQELGQLIDLKCRLGTQTRRFFRKCVSVPCGASVRLKKSPRRCSNPGLWTFGPARFPLGYLGTDYNGSDCLPTRWLVSGPDWIFLHGHWDGEVAGVCGLVCPD